MPDVVRIPSLRLTELDSSPDIQGVEHIYLTDGYLTDMGGGNAILSMSGSGESLYQFTEPVDGDFSWVNQGSATVTTTNGAIHVSCTTNGSAQSMKMRVKTLPAAPYTITVAVIPLLYYAQYSIAAFGLRQSGTTELASFQLLNETGHRSFQLAKWDSSTVPNGSSYIATTICSAMPGPLIFLRVQDDTTNRIFSWSADGQNFMQIHSVGNTDFLTPDQAFFGVNPFSQTTGVTLLSWEETTP